jgi:hypothetical protein
MRRRDLLLAGCTCAALAAALLWRSRSEPVRPAPGDGVPAVREAANSPAAENVEPERQALLAAVEPEAPSDIPVLSETKFEVMTRDGRLVLVDKNGSIHLPPLSNYRTRPSSPLQVFDDRGAAVAVRTRSMSVRTLPPDGAEVTYHLSCDREDLPAQIAVTVMAGEKSVVLPRAHVLRVRVETSDGAAVPFAQVLWYIPGLVNNAVTHADEEGRCMLTRLTPTEVVHVQARPPVTARPSAVSPEFAVTGDADQDLLLVVEPESGGDLFRLRLEDAPESRGATAVLVREPGGGVVARCNVSDTFACGFPHVPSAGTYTLWVAQRSHDSPCVYAAGLRPSALEQTVRAQPAQSLTIRPLFRGRPTGLRLFARRPGLSVEGVAEADGAYIFRGLPEGTVHVIGTAWSDDAEVRLIRGEIDARAGEEVSLSLR